MAKEKLKEFSLEEMPTAELVPIGDVAFDAATGGGIPTKSIIEVFGDEACGKTTLLFEAAKAFLKRFPDKYVYYYSYERSVDAFYVRTLLGNDSEILKRFRIIEPIFLEEGLDHLFDCLDADTGSLYIIDSLAAMTPKAENEKDLEKAQVGGFKAKLLAEGCRKIGVRIAGSSNATVAFINHCMPVLGSFIPQKITPGGKSVKYWSSLRLEITVVGREYKEEITPGLGKNEKIPYMNLVRVKVEKNKYFPPYKRAQVAIRLGKGVDKAYSLIDLGQTAGLIGTKGSGVFYLIGKEDKTVRGKEQFAQKINASKELFDYLYTSIEKFIRAKREEIKNPNVDEVNKSLAINVHSDDQIEVEESNEVDDMMANYADRQDCGDSSCEADIDDLGI